MEVHYSYHPSHLKQWGENFLEFLMLFIAVVQFLCRLLLSGNYIFIYKLRINDNRDCDFEFKKGLL